MQCFHSQNYGDYVSKKKNRLMYPWLYRFEVRICQCPVCILQSESFVLFLRLNFVILVWDKDLPIVGLDVQGMF